MPAQIRHGVPAQPLPGVTTPGDRNPIQALGLEGRHNFARANNSRSADQIAQRVHEWVGRKAEMNEIDIRGFHQSTHSSFPVAAWSAGIDTASIDDWISE